MSESGFQIMTSKGRIRHDLTRRGVTVVLSRKGTAYRQQPSRAKHDGSVQVLATPAPSVLQLKSCGVSDLGTPLLAKLKGRGLSRALKLCSLSPLTILDDRVSVFLPGTSCLHADPGGRTQATQLSCHGLGQRRH
eukprot:3735230-Rhodomonas_salina.2